MNLKSFVSFLYFFFSLFVCHSVIKAEENLTSLVSNEDGTFLLRQSLRRLEFPESVKKFVEAWDLYIRTKKLTCEESWKEIDTNGDKVADEAEITKFIKEKLNPWRKEQGLDPIDENVCKPNPRRALQESQCPLLESCPPTAAPVTIPPTPAPVREPSGGVIGGEKQMPTTHCFFRC